MYNLLLLISINIVLPAVRGTNKCIVYYSVLQKHISVFVKY